MAGFSSVKLKYEMRTEVVRPCDLSTQEKAGVDEFKASLCVLHSEIPCV